MVALDDQQALRKYQKQNGIWVPMIPNPSTWLNQRRWEDAIEKVKIFEVNPQKMEEKKSELERLKEREWERRQL
jgi:hypothetical protein